MARQPSKDNLHHYACLCASVARESWNNEHVVSTFEAVPFLRRPNNVIQYYVSYYVHARQLTFF